MTDLESGPASTNNHRSRVPACAARRGDDWHGIVAGRNHRGDSCVRSGGHQVKHDRASNDGVATARADRQVDDIAFLQRDEGVGVGILQTCAFLTANDWVETKVSAIGNAGHADVVSLSSNDSQDGSTVIGVKRRRDHQHLRLVWLRDNNVDQVFVVDVRGVLNDRHFNALTASLLRWIDIELRQERLVSLQIKTASAIARIDGRERSEVGGRVSSFRISGECCSVVRWSLERVGQGRRQCGWKSVEWSKNGTANGIRLVATRVARRTIQVLTVAGRQERRLSSWRKDVGGK